MKKKYKYKKGDKVRVWSLQSFHGGGFLNGEPAIVRQSQTGDSIILCVIRNFNGNYILDNSYEVYAKQCKPFDSNKKTNKYPKSRKELDDYYVELMNNKIKP